MLTINLKKSFIKSYTAKEFVDKSSGNFLKRNRRVDSLFYTNLYRTFGSTCLFQTRSSEYGSNGKTWHQYILFPSIKQIIQQNKCSVEEAFDIALEKDIKITCDCPSFLYNGFKWRSTVEKYNYGNYKTNIAPTKPLNIQASSTYLVCKHCVFVLKWILSNKDEVVKSFKTYFNRIRFNPDKYQALTDKNELTPVLEDDSAQTDINKDLPEPLYDSGEEVNNENRE